MKRLLITFLMFLSFNFVYSQVCLGTFASFPQKKAKRYDPSLAIAKIGNDYLLALRYVEPSSYAQFDEESVLLIKFEDDKVLKLPFNKEHGVLNEHDEEWLGLIRGGLANYYISNVFFDVNNDFLGNLLDKKNIIKIRVSFTNGDLKDWDIDAKYQPVLTKKLCESYSEVEKEYEIRKKNIENVESGF